MTDATHDLEVISAFVDDEPFDPEALTRALATDEGRQLLIEFIGLRHVVADDGAAAAPIAIGRVRAEWRLLAAAAAVVMALAGGFVAGRSLEPPGQSDHAPAPTRTIELRPGVEWQMTNGGR
jgi:hypothetical protein